MYLVVKVRSRMGASTTTAFVAVLRTHYHFTARSLTINNCSMSYISVAHRLRYGLYTPDEHLSSSDGHPDPSHSCVPSFAVNDSLGLECSSPVPTSACRVTRSSVLGIHLPLCVIYMFSFLPLLPKFCPSPSPWAVHCCPRSSPSSSSISFTTLLTPSPYS
jgi:hypothetical protein